MQYKSGKPAQGSANRRRQLKVGKMQHNSTKEAKTAQAIKGSSTLRISQQRQLNVSSCSTSRRKQLNAEKVGESSFKLVKAAQVGENSLMQRKSEKATSSW
jgi:hypothetical protein